MTTHEQQVAELFARACQILKIRGLDFRPMQRAGSVGKNSSFRLAYLNCKKRVVVIDCYTPRLRRPKKLSSILAVIAHELAHLQKPPYRQRYRGRLINRIHYPAYYQQVKLNLAVFKKDALLSRIFKEAPPATAARKDRPAGPRQRTSPAAR